MVGHVAPEAAEGGPIAVVADGDPITVDVYARALSVGLGRAELAARLERWEEPPPKYATGALAKYAGLVRSASEGAITAPPPRGLRLPLPEGLPA